MDKKGFKMILIFFWQIGLLFSKMKKTEENLDRSKLFFLMTLLKRYPLYHKFHPLRVYHLMVIVNLNLRNHQSDLILEQFHYPQKEPLYTFVVTLHIYLKILKIDRVS